MGGQTGHGRQPHAQLQVLAEQALEARRGAEDFGQGLFDGLQGQAPGRTGDRRGVGQVEQAGDLVGPVPGRRDGGRHAGAQQIGALGLAGDPFGGGGEAFLVHVGQAATTGVAQQALDRPAHQGLEGAHDLMHAQPAGLGLGHGDLLNGVLQFDAGGFQLLDQVGPVQQFEGRRLLAHQPAVQQPADPLTGVDGIEVLRGHAERIVPLRLLLGLDVVRQAEGLDVDAAILVGLEIHRLLGDAGGRHPALGDQLLGHGQGLGAVLRRHLQRPPGGGRLFDENLVMHFGAFHLRSLPRTRTEHRPIELRSD